MGRGYTTYRPDGGESYGIRGAGSYRIDRNGRTAHLRSATGGGWICDVWRITVNRAGVAMTRLAGRRFGGYARARRWAERVLGMYAVQSAA